MSIGASVLWWLLIGQILTGKLFLIMITEWVHFKVWGHLVPRNRLICCLVFVWSLVNIQICIACSIGMHMDAHLWLSMFVLNISLWFIPRGPFTYSYSLSCVLPPSPSPIYHSNSSLSAMQEDALKLVLLALEDGSALSRKVLVLFVVQKLEARFPQASKTSIGHVVQLLYRASCFKVLCRGCERTYTHKNYKCMCIYQNMWVLLMASFKNRRS